MRGKRWIGAGLAAVALWTPGLAQHSGDMDGDGKDELAVGVPGEGVLAPDDRAGAVAVIRGSGSGLTDAGNQLWHQASPGVQGGAEPQDILGRALAWGDFDGDGFDDLAISAPGEDGNTGVVHVLYADGASGLTELGDQLWKQGFDGLVGLHEAGDLFGFALVAGDFNGDGRQDLAVGIPDQDVSGQADAGAVHVLYGSAGGLGALGNVQFHMDTAGVPGTAGAGEQFGFSLATGDFDANGFLDLAIGVPGDGVGNPVVDEAGAVVVVYGTFNGLTTSSSQLLTQNTPGIEEVAEEDDQFGLALAVGDFDGQTGLDLAIGVPYEDLRVRRHRPIRPGGGAGGALAFDLVDVIDAGVVHVVFGGLGTGLSAAGDQLWNQEQTGTGALLEDRDLFGYAVASGSFEGDAFSALAIGCPGDWLQGPGVREAGAVIVLYGSLAGPTSVDSDLWHQDVSGIPGSRQELDRFGLALVEGDFDADGYADLVIGVPGENDGAGGVNVLYGTATGLTATASQWWAQDSPGILGTAEAGDDFGYSLTW